MDAGGGVVGHVPLKEHGVSASRLHLPFDGLGFVVVAAVPDPHVSPGPGKQHGAGRTDPPGGPGDQHYLVGQVNHDNSILFYGREAQ